MNQPTKITFTLKPTDATAKLGFETWIDDHKFYDTDHVTGSEQIAVDISDDHAQHDLRLILKNKAAEHTKIDETGNIIADARLTITDMAFAEIPLGYLLTEQAIYEHDFNGTAQLVQDKFYGDMGCNGTVSLKFSSPIYLWLLEHM
jgi:hypothetical protein